MGHPSDLWAVLQPPLLSIREGCLVAWWWCSKPRCRVDASEVSYLGDTPLVVAPGLFTQQRTCSSPVFAMGCMCADGV